MDPERLLHGLDDAQREAVTSPANPLCVHAGAGSGKTRVLTRRIAWRAATGDLDPRHTLALTFTRKAAGELRSRLRALGLRDDVAAGTFHATAYAQLRLHWADRRRSVPTLLDNRRRFLGELLGDRRHLADAILRELDWAAARIIDPADYPDRAALAGRTPPLPPEQLVDLAGRYRQAKRKAHVVDFDDLLAFALRLMTTDADAAAAYRWRFRHLVVDEFQDVNRLQYQLLRAWLGDGDDLFVVGDPNQAIYGWNGADARYLDRFTEVFPVERYPGVGFVRLRSNYRSSPEVLAVAAAVLDTLPLRPHRPSGERPVVLEHPDEEAEAAAIAQSIRDRHQEGAPWSSHAVLVRTAAQGVVISEALRTAGVPFRLRGADQLLGHPTVKAILRRLRVDPYEVVLSDLRSGEVHPDEESGDPEQDEGDRAVVLALAGEFEALHPTPSGGAFADWIATALRAGDGHDRDVVEISTFHAAKGLEWPAVHLAGLEAGLVPIAHAKTAEARDEEQRLLYVAITRAQEELTLHWAATRDTGGKRRERERSPWLDAVDAVLDRLDEADRPVDGRHHLDRPRAELLARQRAERSPVDDALARLEAWRDDAARAGRVEAQAIVDDATLKELAATRPSTVDDLAAVTGLGPIKAARWGDELVEVLRPVRLVDG